MKDYYYLERGKCDASKDPEWGYYNPIGTRAYIRISAEEADDMDEAFFLGNECSLCEDGSYKIAAELVNQHDLWEFWSRWYRIRDRGLITNDFESGCFSADFYMIVEKFGKGWLFRVSEGNDYSDDVRRAVTESNRVTGSGCSDEEFMDYCEEYYSGLTDELGYKMEEFLEKLFENDFDSCCSSDYDFINEYLINDRFIDNREEILLQIAICGLGTDEECRRYVAQHFEEALHMVIDEEEIEFLKNLCDAGLLTEENIDSAINYAIAHTQKNGSPEAQILLMNYKHDHFGSTAENLKL